MTGTFDDNIKADVKSPFFRDWQMRGHATICHILSTKQEKLLFFYDMSHIIVRAIPAVRNKDAGSIIGLPDPVHHSAESFVFIFAMNWLDDGVLISMGIKVIEGIEKEAVNSFGGMALGDKVNLIVPLGSAEKGKRRAVSSKQFVFVWRVQRGE